MRITRVTTKKGDDGTTSLARGERVGKDSARIEALGSLDEVNSAIGVALTHEVDEEIQDILAVIQNVLFNMGGELSTVDQELDLVSDKDVQFLEENIESLNASLAPLEEFILPGGSQASASLHMARSICRRAERAVVALNREESIRPIVLAYLNRLSDLLFVAARYQNASEGGEETMWKK